MLHRSRSLIAVIRSQYFVPVCLIIYLGLRLALTLTVPVSPTSDELWYYARAVSLASGQGYSENHVLTAYWPVGWPGFLGLVFRLFGSSLFVGQMVNLLCSATIFVLTLRLGSILFRDELVGRLGVLLLTVYPNEIAYVPILATETFYTMLLLLAIYLLVSGVNWWRWVAAGAVFGIATLTKAQTLLLPLMLLCAWWIFPGCERRWFYQLGRAAIVYAAMATVILPWTARNYHVFGAIVPISTNGGMALLTGNNPGAQGGFTPNNPLVKEVPRGVAQQVASDHLATQLALTWVREHPSAAIALIPKKIWWLWAPDGEAEWAYQAGYKNYSNYWEIFRAVRIANQAYYVTLIMLCVLSLFYWPRINNIPIANWCVGYIVIMYTTLVSIVCYGMSRYHFPTVPLIALYVAWTIVRLFDQGQRLIARPAVVTADRSFLPFEATSGVK